MTASKKNKNVDYGLGEFLVPLFDIFNLIMLKGIEGLTKLIGIGLDKYVFKKESKAVVKIERKHLENKRSTLSDDAIGYSTTKRKNILGSDLDRSAHTVVIGASGAGKTVLLDTLMFDDMQRGKPVVYIDPKGDNETLMTFINLCLIAKRDFAIFSEYYKGVGACSINPVKDGSVTNIADRIFNSFTWSEEHYAQLCYDALEFSIKSLMQENALISLESIHKKLLFISNPKKDLKEEKEKEEYFARDDISGIISRIRKFISSDFGPKLQGKNALSFKDIRESKKCVYIGLSVLGYSQMARSLGKMILGDVAYTAYDTYRHITPISKKDLQSLGIYVDELSAIITPDDFIELLNKVRGAKMELTFGFQSPSDLKKVDEELIYQVLENTSNWFIFKQRMREGAQLFSDSIGTNKSFKQTLRIEDGQEQAQGSQRVVEELTAHSNIIKNLGKGQCVLLQHFPTRLDLLNVKFIDPVVAWNNVEFLKAQGLLPSSENNKMKTSPKKSKKNKKKPMQPVVRNFGDDL